MKDELLDRLVNNCDIHPDFSEEVKNYETDFHSKDNKRVTELGNDAFKGGSFMGIKHDKYQFLNKFIDLPPLDGKDLTELKQQHQKFFDNFKKGCHIADNLDNDDECFRVKIFGDNCHTVNFRICMGPPPSTLETYKDEDQVTVRNFPHTLFDPIKSFDGWKIEDGWWSYTEHFEDNYFLRTLVWAFIDPDIDTGMTHRYWYRQGIVEAISYLWD